MVVVAPGAVVILAAMVVILAAMVVILVAMADRYPMALRRSRLRLRRHLPSKLLPGADLRVA
jgi:amino acid transporter